MRPTWTDTTDLGTYQSPEALGRWAPLVRWAERRGDRARVKLARKGVETRAAGNPAPRDSSTSPGTRVLDLGCGRPSFLRALRLATGWEMTGLDVSDDGWRGDDAGFWSGLDLRVGTMEDQGLLDGPFHLITLWHVLEHASAPRVTLRRLHRLSAPDAALLVEVPDHASIPRRL